MGCFVWGAVARGGSGEISRGWIVMDLSCSVEGRKGFQAGFDVIKLAFEEDDRWLCRELARSQSWV